MRGAYDGQHAAPMLRPLLLALLTACCLAADPAHGANRRLPCTGSEETYDLYLPKAYAEEPERRFPVLFISDPGGNPNWRGLEDWAERQGVVMATINGSKNGPWEPIHAAQKAVTETVFATYRIHPCLRFSMGFSGGAWASAVLAGKFKDDWAGVVMCGSGWGSKDAKAKHIMIGYHMGTEEKVMPIERAREALKTDREAGHLVRGIERPVGHVWGDTAELAELLDWMLEHQRLAHPRLSAEDKAAGAARIRVLAASAAAVAEPAPRREACERLLAIEAAAALPELKPVREAWLGAVLAGTDDGADPVAAWRSLDQAARSPWGLAVAGAPRKELQKRVEALQRKPPVKAEIDAAKALEPVKAAEVKMGSAKGAIQQVLAGYQAIAKRWGDTEAGRTAAAAAERLAAKAK